MRASPPHCSRLWSESFGPHSAQHPAGLSCSPPWVHPQQRCHLQADKTLPSAGLQPEASLHCVKWQEASRTPRAVMGTVLTVISFPRCCFFVLFFHNNTVKLSVVGVVHLLDWQFLTDFSFTLREIFIFWSARKKHCSFVSKNYSNTESW